MKLLKGLQFFYNAFIKGDDQARYHLAEMVSRVIYKRYKFSEYGRIYLYDEDFMQYYKTFELSGNFHSLDRKYALDQIIQLCTALEGDTAECGVYKGASSYLICRRTYKLKKLHHIFDSFEGLSEPSIEDGAYWKKGDLSMGEHVVRNHLCDFENVKYHKGWIPTQFHSVSDSKFCFVHLDIDLYRPTLDSLKFFYQRLVPGGIILCDDYGFITCPGAKKAMDDYFSDKIETIVSLPTGQGFIIKKSIDP